MLKHNRQHISFPLGLRSASCPTIAKTFGDKSKTIDRPRPVLPTSRATIFGHQAESSRVEPAFGSERAERRQGSGSARLGSARLATLTETRTATFAISVFFLFASIIRSAIITAEIRSSKILFMRSAPCAAEYKRIQSRPVLKIGSSWRPSHASGFFFH